MIILKILYKPIGILVSVLGGVVAGVLFKRIWKLAAHEDEAPDATDAQRGWVRCWSPRPCTALFLPWSRRQRTGVPPPLPGSSLVSGRAKEPKPKNSRVTFAALPPGPPG